MPTKKLATAAHDGLFRPEELVGGLAIREATAEVVSRRDTAAFAMAGNRVDGPSLLATVRLDGIFTADSENAYLSSMNFHGG